MIDTFYTQMNFSYTNITIAFIASYIIFVVGKKNIVSTAFLVAVCVVITIEYFKKVDEIKEEKLCDKLKKDNDKLKKDNDKLKKEVSYAKQVVLRACSKEVDADRTTDEARRGCVF